MKPGDRCEATAGLRTFYHCVITEVKRGECNFDVEGSEAVAQLTMDIHIAVSPTNNLVTMERFVEKATEVGVSSISFIECDHSERRKFNEDRLRKIAISALKQSQK